MDSVSWRMLYHDHVVPLRTEFMNTFHNTRKLTLHIFDQSSNVSNRILREQALNSATRLSATQVTFL
jgi:conjugal transfer/entry exclusion protein